MKLHFWSGLRWFGGNIMGASKLFMSNLSSAKLLGTDQVDKDK